MVPKLDGLAQYDPRATFFCEHMPRKSVQDIKILIADTVAIDQSDLLNSKKVPDYPILRCYLSGFDARSALRARL